MSKATSSGILQLPGKKGHLLTGGVKADLAGIVTVTVLFTGDPFGATDEGENEQDDPAGKPPLQLNNTA